MTAAPVLQAITTETKDGEWGKGEPFESSVEMAVIRGTDFERVRIGEFSELPIRYIPERIASRKTLRAYDILIETAGGSKDRPTGRTLFVKPSLIAKSELPLTCASFARFIRIDPFKAEPSYVFWLLQYLYGAGFIKQYHTQHTGVARFQFTTFAERELLRLPPKPIQNKIASILSPYDDLIENNTRRIRILEAMAKMIYREWFVNFRFPGYEKVSMSNSKNGPIPNGWQSLRVGDVLQMHIGGGWGEEEKRDGYTIPARVIRGTDIPDARMGDFGGCPLRFHKVSNFKSRKLQAGDIVFEVSGGSKGQPVGRALLIHPRTLNALGADVICASFCKLLRPDPSKIGIVHLYGYLLDSYTNGQIEKYQVQSTGITNFKFAVFLEDARIVVPPEAIRIEFENISQLVVDAINVLGRKNAVLRQSRDMLLPKLMSGEISVEQIETEAAAQDV